MRRPLLPSKRSTSRQEHPRGTLSCCSPGIPACTAPPAAALAPGSGGGYGSQIRVQKVLWSWKALYLVSY